MSKIKGRYVATIIFDFDYDENDEKRNRIRTFSENQTILKDGILSETIEKVLLHDVFGDGLGTLKVEQQYADLYKPAEDERGRV